MPSVFLEIKGLDKLEARLRRGIPQAKQNVKVELYQFGEEVMAESKSRVPVDTGALMSTGKVAPPEESGNVIKVTLGYGDEAAGYALYVHEALEGSRPPSPNWSWTKAVEAGKTIQWTRPGSGPKYLENPLKEKQDKLPPRVLAAIKRGFLG